MCLIIFWPPLKTVALLLSILPNPRGPAPAGSPNRGITDPILDVPKKRSQRCWWNRNTRPIAELIALGATVAIWAIAQPLDLHVPVLAGLVTAWTTYFIIRAWRRPGLLRDWGVLSSAWGHAARLHTTAAVLALVVVAALGAAQGTLTVPPHIWFIILVYPAWAWCQQFILQNAFVANAGCLGIPRKLLPIAGGIAFGGAHLPDLPLAGLTMMGGLLWTWLFLRAPNLWLLALSHAVVGTLAFLWVLGRDPLMEYPTVLEWLG